jgi:hypothetical protein
VAQKSARTPWPKDFLLQLTPPQKPALFPLYLPLRHPATLPLCHFFRHRARAPWLQPAPLRGAHASSHSSTLERAGDKTPRWHAQESRVASRPISSRVRAQLLTTAANDPKASLVGESPSESRMLPVTRKQSRMPPRPARTKPHLGVSQRQGETPRRWFSISSPCPLSPVTLLTRSPVRLPFGPTNSPPSHPSLQPRPSPSGTPLR